MTIISPFFPQEQHLTSTWNHPINNKEHIYWIWPFLSFIFRGFFNLFWCFTFVFLSCNVFFKGFSWNHSYSFFLSSKTAYVRHKIFMSLNCRRSSTALFPTWISSEKQQGRKRIFPIFWNKQCWVICCPIEPQNSSVQSCSEKPNWTEGRVPSHKRGI